MSKQYFSKRPGHKARAALVKADPRIVAFCEINERGPEAFELGYKAAREWLLTQTKCPQFNYQNDCREIKHQIERLLEIYVPLAALLAALFDLGFELRLSGDGQEIYTNLAPIEPNLAFVQARPEEHRAILTETPIIEVDEFGMEAIR